MKRVLILTGPGDLHAFAVAEAIKAKGSEAVIWHTGDFPRNARESISLANGQIDLRIDGFDLSLTNPDFDTVWRRRPFHVLPLEILHPADRRFAEAECTVFRRSLLDELSPQAFWVNRPDAAIRANRKLLQQRAALECGLETPATLYTNDPVAIRSFIQEHGGEVVFKTYRPMAWQDGTTAWQPYTSHLTEEKLVSDALLGAVPGIYQALIPKAFELRVTVMGRCVLSAKLLSQQTREGQLDWRKAYEEIVMEPFLLPPSIATCCFELLKTLDIVFGCFDFIVTPQGSYVFLEVNEMGQFLFVEDYAGLPLLEAFSEFLLFGSPDFEWSPGATSLSYLSIKEHASRLAEEAARYHTSLPDHSEWEEAK
ncbi:MAG TPA: hypothetical protein VGG20_27955 [Thermoanaerobaculia bacterium]|jgi:glutathione synthase/RimK-type ligase-like ATP-grasp enzyme